MLAITCELGVGGSVLPSFIFLVPPNGEAAKVKCSTYRGQALPLSQVCHFHLVSDIVNTVKYSVLGLANSHHC